jgi:glyoxylase-like metal-dependent hydrolase (beta-lactamase superfamily II)
MGARIDVLRFGVTNTYLRPRFGVFAHEPELVPASWRRLLEMGVRTVYPAHGRPFPASALKA